LRADALEQLVEDKLKLQAGEETGITPTPQMIADGIAQYAERAGVRPEEFRARMNGRGVTDQALDDYVSAQLVWLNVIRARFGSQLEPGAAEIDAEMSTLGGAAGTEYRILEIGLPLTGDGRTQEETRALAEELSASLNQGGDFAAAVARYSRSPSAARGGDVGWVQSGLMPPELRARLEELEVGEVSRPVPVSGGISVVKLIEKRQGQAAAGAGSRSREAVRSEMINQRSERLAEGLLQEMRRDALIEVR
jgi:parvulin-like peptidyl-prolyl isomerase